MRASGKVWRWAVALAAAVLLWGCVEKPPVEEVVRLEFHADGSLRLEIRTVLREDPEEPERTSTLLLPILDRYERGRDEWLLRMGEWGLDDLAHRLTVEDGEGEQEGRRTHTILRTAATRDPRLLVPRIFAQEPVFVDLTWERGLWTLELLPQAEPRQLREHRTQARREVARVAEDISRAQERLRALYLYLQDRRDRRTLVLAALDGEPRSAGEEGEKLDEHEAGLVRELLESAESVLDRTEAPLMESASLHPLDEGLMVSLPVPAEGAAGFTEVGEKRRWAVTEVDLDELVLGLLDEPFDPRIIQRWDELVPDGKPSRELLLSAPFDVAPLPFADELRARIWDALARPGPYRLEWRASAPQTGSIAAEAP